MTNCAAEPICTAGSSVVSRSDVRRFADSADEDEAPTLVAFLLSGWRFADGCHSICVCHRCVEFAASAATGRRAGQVTCARPRACRVSDTEVEDENFIGDFVVMAKPLNMIIPPAAGSSGQGAPLSTSTFSGTIRTRRSQQTRRSQLMEWNQLASAMVTEVEDENFAPMLPVSGVRAPARRGLRRSSLTLI